MKPLCSLVRHCFLPPGPTQAQRPIPAVAPPRPKDRAHEGRRRQADVGPSVAVTTRISTAASAAAMAAGAGGPRVPDAAAPAAAAAEPEGRASSTTDPYPIEEEQPNLDEPKVHNEVHLRRTSPRR